MDDTCAVCAETLEWVAYGPCGHRDVCSTCIVRLRFVMEDNKCCICKTVCPSVFVTKVFICEQKLYSRSQLTQHMKTGDSDVDGSELERSGFAGHPMQHPGLYDYFRNYDDLELHFRKDHFLCEDEACLAKKFVVFPSEAELKAIYFNRDIMLWSTVGGCLVLKGMLHFRYLPVLYIEEMSKINGVAESLNVGSSSGGAEASSRTGRVLEQLSFPPLSDPDIPDTRVETVPDETSFPSLSEQQSRYALALNQSARGAARLGDESLFPPLPGSSNSRGPASAQQGLQSLAKSTLAARLQQRSKGPVKVLNTARPRPFENPELLPSSTQTWPTPDQGQLLSGSSQLRIGTQPTRENGFVSTGSSNSAWNPVAPNKMKHSVSTPNLVSGGQPSSSAAYSSNKSQEPPQGSQPLSLPVAEDVRAANKSLVERMRSALGMDEDRYSAFKEIAGEYRQGIIDTSEYLSYVEQFGLSHLVPEMARLLPDPQKQRELADAYYTDIQFKSLQENGGGGTSSQEGNRKKKGKGKAPVAESSAAKDVKVALADNFLDTVRRLQPNHQAHEGEAEVLSKDGYRPSKGVQQSSGSSSSLDIDAGFNSKSSGAKDNAGKGGGSSSKQPKKTSKFLRARLGDNSLATLDLSRPSASPERPERESQGPQMGLPGSLMANCEHFGVDGLVVGKAFVNGKGHYVLRRGLERALLVRRAVEAQRSKGCGAVLAQHPSGVATWRLQAGATTWRFEAGAVTWVI
nr:unnamed protein product [Digitaria exilis]